MRVGVIGYYGYGNAGDERILDIIKVALTPHDVIGFPVDFPDHPTIFPRLNAFDYLILGGGGLFNEKPPGAFASFDRWQCQLTAPIGVLGLGVEKLDTEFLPAVTALVERSEFFVVRDEESKRLIGHPKTQIAPDLTFFRPVPMAIQQNHRSEVTCGINLRPFGPNADGWLEAARTLPGTKRTVSLSTVPTFNDRELLIALDPNCPKTFDHSIYADIDVLVGTAFHSIVFAVQAAVPVVAISYHPKVRRLMNEIGLSDYVLRYDEHARLAELYSKVLEDRKFIRQKMLDYTMHARGRLQDVFREVGAAIAEHANKCTEIEKSLPPVTVAIDCTHASREDVRRTLDSCLSQSHRDVGLTLVGRANRDMDSDFASLIASADTSASAGDHPDEVLADSLKHEGYLVCIPGGFELTADALAVLAELLEETPEADLYYCDFYITAESNILHRVSVSNLRTPDQLAATSACFIVRQSVVTDELADLPTDILITAAQSRRSLHVPYALAFRAATKAELDCISSAVAFGRGQHTKAQYLLADAALVDPQLVTSKRHQEKFFGIFLACAFSRSVSHDPIAYFETVISNFPTMTSTLRRAKHPFVARVSLEEAHIWSTRGQKKKALASILRCIQHDPRWLKDRGLISFATRHLIRGGSTPHSP